MGIRVIILSILAVVVGGLSYGAYCVHRVATVVVPNAYAADWVSEFVIEHLKSSDNQWPTNWNDLRDEYDAHAEPSQCPWSWEELQVRVKIDWDADPTILAMQTLRHTHLSALFGYPMVQTLTGREANLTAKCSNTFRRQNDPLVCGDCICLPSSINAGSRYIIFRLANVVCFDPTRRRPHYPLSELEWLQIPSVNLNFLRGRIAKSMRTFALVLSPQRTSSTDF